MATQMRDYIGCPSEQYYPHHLFLYIILEFVAKKRKGKGTSYSNILVMGSRI